MAYYVFRRGEGLARSFGAALPFLRPDQKADGESKAPSEEGESKAPRRMLTFTKLGAPTEKPTRSPKCPPCPEAPLCPEMPPCPEVPSCAEQGYLTPEECAAAGGKTEEAAAKGGIAWWWLLVAAAGGLGVGYAIGRGGGKGGK